MELHTQDTQSKLSVSSEIFDRPFNGPLVHQIVVAYRNAARAGTKAQKTRSEVAGTTKKSKKQKGGGARHGALTAPIFVGGGVTFAAKPRLFDQKVNRKQYRAAIASILSELLRQNRLVVMDAFDVDQTSTSQLAKKIHSLKIDNHTMIVNDFPSDHLYLSARNIPHLEVCDVQSMNPVSLIRAHTVILTSESIKKIEEWLA